MRFAKIEESARLQRVANLLSSGGEHSTLEIITKSRVCAVNSIVSELRRNGYVIACIRRNDRWFYRLNKSATRVQRKSRH